MKLLFIVLTFFLTGCSDWFPDDLFLSVAEVKEQKQVRDKIVWKQNEDGVRYFITCVDGYKFAATYIDNRAIALGGHLGKCKK